ncbi:hypothetical protein BDN72DRAFT_850790, partial [Pluteus cervinus]
MKRYRCFAQCLIYVSSTTLTALREALYKVGHVMLHKHITMYSACLESCSKDPHFGLWFPLSSSRSRFGVWFAIVDGTHVGITNDYDVVTAAEVNYKGTKSFTCCSRAHAQDTFDSFFRNGAVIRRRTTVQAKL